MLISIKSKSDAHVEFFIEREKGIYNNVQFGVMIDAEATKNFTSKQVNQWAWEQTKQAVYDTFHRVEPIQELETFLDDEYEPIPEVIPPARRLVSPDGAGIPLFDLTFDQLKDLLKREGLTHDN